MTRKGFITVWPLLARQVRSLGIPWLDDFAASRRDPFRVLIACLLSLRTQDKVTEGASRRLFSIAQTPESLATLQVRQIENAIYPTGFYRVKARRIREMSREILDKHSGRVPDSIDSLLTLKGVGRKTANLVVTLGYGKPGICVDTHVHRIANRWGLVHTRTPEQTESALRGMLPIKYWRKLNSILVAFGQNICRPASPLCSQCSVYSVCSRTGVYRSR